MTSGELKSLFYTMLRIRKVEEKIADLYPEQEMRCPVHLCIGQEAIAAGVCGRLRPDDYVMSGHRSHGHYLAKGGNLRAFIAELYGKVTGCCKGVGGSMYLVDLNCGFLGATPIVAATIPIAVGAAFGSMLGGESRVAVIFFGDAAVEEGVFHEALNFAALHRAPIVFVCENNLYSVYSPLSVRQPANRELVELARGHGVESVQGDGNDVIEVYTMLEPAVRNAREGRGPTFFEFKTYRWREHCGPNYDNTLGYRAEAEFEEWKKLCPIDRMSRRLLNEGVLSPGDIEDMTIKIAREIDEAVTFAKQSPFPGEAQLWENIYAP